MEIKETLTGGRNCRIYDCGSPDVLLVQPVDDHDLAVLDSEVAHIEALTGGKGFTLAAFKVNDWNTDLTPWEAEPVFGDAGFGSGAPETLDYITKSLLPELTDGRYVAVLIGGYSLAGLFSLWAGYTSDMFAGIAACSPSVWFPGWTEFAEERSVKAPLVYLSLGDKEERTRNPVMQMVGDRIRRQREMLEADAGCRECELEMNAGNHFREPDLRTAKGFAWLLERLEG